MGDIEIFTSVEDISKYSKKEKEKYVNELFKNEYQGKEIEYFLNTREIQVLINRTTRNNFKATSHSGYTSENKKEYTARQNIAFSGDYLQLVDDAQYSSSNKDAKIGQNKYHKDNTMWHNFNKVIIFDGDFYNVIVNVREQDGKYYIYNTKLKEVDSSMINLTYGSGINQSQCLTSSMDSITDEKIK